MNELPETFTIVHAKHGRATIHRDQWNAKGQVGWDEASARKAGWVPEHEPAGRKLAAKLDAPAEPPAPKDPPQDPPKDPPA